MLYDGNNPILSVTGARQLRIGCRTLHTEPQSFSELIFLISGTVTVTFGDTVISAKQGDILYLPQGLPYTVSYWEAEQIRVAMVLLNRDPQPELHSLVGYASFQKLFSSLLFYESRNDASQNINCISLVYRILCTMLSRSRIPPHMEKALKYIHANYQNCDLTVGQVCQHAGISQTTLRKYILSRYNQSPIQLITTLRLQQARTLIAAGISVEEAAQQSGFNDPKYFARVVKKYYNRTPSELKDFE